MNVANDAAVLQCSKVGHACATQSVAGKNALVLGDNNVIFSI